MYRISIDYPDNARVEFNSKGRREAGDVAFHLPENIRIFLSWGELEKVSKRFNSVQEHAEYSLDAMKKGKNVGNFESASNDSMTINTHKAALSRVKFDEMIASIPFAAKKPLKRSAYSIHVHCDISNRYFVLYTMSPNDDQRKYDKILTTMAESFKCH
jgi:hypothetical protein